MRVENTIPILNVTDLAASLRFYVEGLGFGVDWSVTAMASVSRDGCPIMLCEGGQGQPGTWVWIGCEDVRAFHARAVELGAEIRMPPTRQAWALETQIVDPDGHVLRFGSDPDEA